MYPSTMSVKGFLDKYFGAVTQTVIEKVPFAIPIASASVSVPVPSPRTFHIFTDGACSDNGRRGARGGFGVHFYSKKSSGLDVCMPLAKSEPQTNNRGELRAIQAALDVLETHRLEWDKDFEEYCIWSDSEYSIHCLTKWATSWRRNGWRKGDGGLIQNIDLIKPVYEKLVRMRGVRLQHVRAHQRGREKEFPYDGNTEADRLARESITLDPYGRLRTEQQLI